MHYTYKKQLKKEIIDIYIFIKSMINVPTKFIDCINRLIKNGLLICSDNNDC